MVPFKVYELYRKHVYRYVALEGVSDTKRYERTVKNLNKMLDENKDNSVYIISPERKLTVEELEEYRKYFCKKAKQIGHNCVYFEVPVLVKEVKNA